MLFSYSSTAQPAVWRGLRPNTEVSAAVVAPRAARNWTIDELLDRGQVIASFVNRIESLGPLAGATAELQSLVFKEVADLARRIDASGETGVDAPYGRRVLYEDPERWSIAAVLLRPGQSTECHDHGGWGCAVTVQGIERDRRFAAQGHDTLSPLYERNYPAGTGYVFDSTDVHQPLGADPDNVTVALHFLVQESHAQAHAEVGGAQTPQAA